MDKLAAATAAANTFGAVAREVLENKQANDAAEATMAKNPWLLEELAAPLADRPIDEARWSRYRELAAEWEEHTRLRASLEQLRALARDIKTRGSRTGQ